MTDAVVRAASWSTHAAAAVVQEAVARSRVVTAIHPVGEVGSTQDVARDLAAGGASPGTLVIADRQLAGRGRAGRRWDDDPHGGSLAMTLLLDADLEAVSLVPHALGLAVLDACRAIAPAARGIALKWPNDVIVRARPVWGARKLAGVLVERELGSGTAGPRDVLLCGIGLNVLLVGSSAAPDRVCISEVARTEPDRAALLAALITALDDGLALLASRPTTVLERYRTACDTIGREVRIDLPDGAVVGGVVSAVDDGGRLVVGEGSGALAILSGTVREILADGETMP